MKTLTARGMYVIHPTFTRENIPREKEGYVKPDGARRRAQADRHISHDGMKLRVCPQNVKNEPNGVDSSISLSALSCSAACLSLRRDAFQYVCVEPFV